MVIAGGLYFPDSIDAAMDEGDARNMIVRLVQIRRRATREDKVWSMTQLLNFMKLSPYISCKKAALNGMGPFFDELEEMQEQATDAVYDLCEDADSDVRIAGYQVLPQLVARNHTWTVRNTDVLVQLLQSEDADELSTVRQSIAACIGHDPTNALSVILDYAVAVPDTDESHNPELRNCVLDFMLYHFELPAKEALAKVPEAIKPFSRAIVKVLSTANPRETVLLVEKLLQPIIMELPVAVLIGSVTGAIIEKAAASLANEDNQRRISPPLLPITTAYLEECVIVASLDDTDAGSARFVLDFVGTKLLAANAFLVTTDDERITIACRTLELFRKVTEMPSIDTSGFAATRAVLATHFDKLADTLLKAIGVQAHADARVSWELLYVLLANVALPSWENTKDHVPFERQLRSIKQSAERWNDLPYSSDMLTMLKKFDSRPTIRRPPALQTSPPSLPPHSNSLLKRKAAPRVSPTMASQGQSSTLLARLQPAESAGERSTKRVKKELSLLDRLQTSSSSPSPDPTSSPYSDIRIKNASASDSTQSLLEPLRRTSIDEKGGMSQVNRGRTDLPPVSSSAISQHNAKLVALPAALSIRGAASKSAKPTNIKVVAKEPRPAPSIRRPSLLERTFPAPENQAQTIETPEPPNSRSFRERLSGPSLKERLMPEPAEAVGDQGSRGRRTRGGKR